MSGTNGIHITSDRITVEKILSPDTAEVRTKERMLGVARQMCAVELMRMQQEGASQQSLDQHLESFAFKYCTLAEQIGLLNQPQGAYSHR